MPRGVSGPKLCNTQSELHPLEEGKHAAQSGMDLKSYAEKAGKESEYRNLAFKKNAWIVFSAIEHMFNADQKLAMRSAWRSVGDVISVPEWLWPAMVETMLQNSWTVAVTREQVAKHKDIGDVPDYRRSRAG